jgi:extracellular elastinolytic metalloproteinase
MTGVRSRRQALVQWSGAIAGLVALVLVVTTAALGAGDIEGIHDGALPNYDARTGAIAPGATQLAAVEALGATATWNNFGTPHVLSKEGAFLATGVQGDDAIAAAKNWLAANRDLFRLSSVDSLVLHGDSQLAGTQGHAVTLRQRFGSLDAFPDGIVTVGLTGTPSAGWNVAYVASTLTGADSTAGEPQLSLQEGWAHAATTVGLSVALPAVGPQLDVSGGYATFAVGNFAEQQYARPLAFVTPSGVVPAIEALVLGGPEPLKGAGPSSAGSYSVIVDARDGSLLMRTDLVHSLDGDSVQTFSGDFGAADGGCGPLHAIEVPANTKSLEIAATADVPANDIVLDLLRNGQVVGHTDTGTSPEAIHYAPAGDVTAGTYHARVCEFVDGAAPLPVTTYTGTVAINDVAAASATPYPPLWRVFPREPLPGALDANPWHIPSTDARKLWCWEKTWNGGTIDACDEEVSNAAARAPWDYDPKTNQPTFTTRGNNALASEAWTDPLAPGPFGHQPFAADRNYSYPWTNAWYESGCNPNQLQPHGGNDISASVANLFAMHNRMHDWSYNLGFTEESWNMQSSNYGNLAPPPAGLPLPPGGENDPVLGQSQAGALTGGSPNFLGRDNANMRPLPDGISPITNMYLWQPLAGAFYAPCVDGDYDMPVIGHEYGHAIENRMIGKGWVRTGDHAGAMGESNGDLNGMEVVNEYDYQPGAGVNRYAVGSYATGNKQRGIRNFAMNWPGSGAAPAPGSTPRVNPLNFGDLGYDLTGGQVHADGEIWSKVNFSIRQALAAKYDAGFPSSDTALQRRCANGEMPADRCPGNRRWIQLVYDAYLLMPIGPSMLEARDAYLAADLMRSSDPTLAWPSNRNELWLEFARHGFGQGAFSTTAFSNHSDRDPIPDFASPVQAGAKVVFKAVSPDDGNIPVHARIYTGWYEGRVSPVADTDPATPGTAAPTGAAENLDDTAFFAPGTYEFVANAGGYGHQRFRLTLAAGQTKTVTLSFASNWASKDRGAAATGDGVNFVNLIDDTEETQWERTGSTDVRGTQVTVDLAGTQARKINRVQVSGMLMGQNRFTAVRQFAVQACNASALNLGCTLPTGFSTVYTSPADAFPAGTPRPVSPELLIRSFDIPATNATHVRLVVLTNQCTGNPAYQDPGDPATTDQDHDPTNDTDCRLGSPPYGVSADVPVVGPVGLGRAPQQGNVRIAELQVFSRPSTVK